VQNEFTRSLLDPLPYRPRGEPEEQLLDQLFIAAEGKQQSIYSTSYSFPQRGTRGEAVIHCPRGEPEEKQLFYCPRGEPEEATYTTRPPTRSPT